MAKKKDISGRKFGRLTAIKPVGTSSDGQTIWRCKCKCGKEKNVLIGNLTSGSTVSCGCYRNEHVYRNFNGCHDERLYNIWSLMKRRILNPNAYAYHRYGGRGIKICDEWIENYYKFKEWALNNGYEEDLTLDRINNDGDYEPYNCRWVTMHDQTRNKSNNRYFTYNGETKVMQDFATQYGINSVTLKRRIDSGWTIDEALTTPLYKKRKAKVGDSP